MSTRFFRIAAPAELVTLFVLLAGIGGFLVLRQVTPTNDPSQNLDEVPQQ